MIELNEPIEPGSDDWLTACRQFHQEHGQWPWDAFREDVWAVSKTPEGALYVGWRVSAALAVLDEFTSMLREAIETKEDQQ